MYQKRNKELEILALYAGDYRKRFYLREISKLAKMPLKTTQDTVKRLEKGNILKSLREGKNKYFMLNLDEMRTRLFLLEAETHKTLSFLEKYPLFKTFLKEVSANHILIVFGSFARFAASRNSDLDLLVIPKEIPLHSHLLPYNVHEVNMSEKSFSKALEGGEVFIKEVEANHIILNNHSFYVNTMWKHYYARQT